MKSNLRNYSLVAQMVVLTLMGCGGGGGGGGVGSSVSPTIVSGVASKGILSGSDVCAFAITGGGQGTSLGSCSTTDINGNYSINLGTYSGEVLLVATGGTYVDEATGKLITLSLPMHSILLNATGGSFSVSVTAMTELAYQNTAAMSGGLTGANIQSSINLVQNNSGVPDIINTMPVDALNVPNNATALQKVYSLALATLSQYLNGLPAGTTLTTALKNLQTCLATPATACGTGATSIGTQLNTAWNTFVASHVGFSGLTLPVINFGSAASVSRFDGTYTGNWNISCPNCGGGPSNSSPYGTFTATILNGLFTSSVFTTTFGIHGIPAPTAGVSSTGTIMGSSSSGIGCSNSPATFTGQISAVPAGGFQMVMDYSRPSSPTTNGSGVCEVETGTITGNSP